MRGARHSAGFTLVEMLIALTIFGMLSAAAVTLLSFSVRAQDMADQQLGLLSSIRRTGSLLTADLAQATGRTWRDGEGRQQLAFLGATSGDARLMVFVRSGWDNPDGAARSSLQRVEYRLQGGRLYRIGYTHVDGNGTSAISALLDDVRALGVRYRNRDGVWQDVWQSGDPRELPLAVELTVTTGALPETRQVFLVGPGR